MAKKTIQLRQICHARSGDKANNVNAGIIVYNPKHYPVIAEQVTAEKVKKHFGEMVQGDVERYEMPNINAINFVLRKALGGGASDTMFIDNLGKCYGASLLRMEIEIEESLL